MEDFNEFMAKFAKPKHRLQKPRYMDFELDDMDFTFDKTDLDIMSSEEF